MCCYIYVLLYICVIYIYVCVIYMSYTYIIYIVYTRRSRSPGIYIIYGIYPEIEISRCFHIGRSHREITYGDCFI